MSKQVIILAATAVGSLAAGGAGGYLLARRQLETKFNKILDEEVAKVQEHYEKKTKQGRFVSPEEAARTLIPKDSEVPTETLERVRDGLIKSMDYGSAAVPKPRDFASEVVEAAKKGEVVLNIFEETRRGTIDQSEFTEEDEEARSEERPYILRVEEYMNGEVGYPQEHLTFYEGDMVLADDEDAPVGEYDKVVGVENLNHFGKWSGDRNTVFIRNEIIGYDYEVTRQGGSFKEIVLGYVDEHAVKNRFVNG